MLLFAVRVTLDVGTCATPALNVPLSTSVRRSVYFSISRLLFLAPARRLCVLT